MRILGIDPGTGIVGFGVIETDGHKHTLVDAGVIRTPAHQPLVERLDTIFHEIESLIKELKPTVMVVEELFFAKNVKTAISVSHARGVILLAGKKAGLEVAEYTPLQIKQAVTGYGRAEKQQIQEMVRIMLRLKVAPKPDDCADALAAAICHSSQLLYK